MGSAPSIYIKKGIDLKAFNTRCVKYKINIDNVYLGDDVEIIARGPFNILIPIGRNNSIILKHRIIFESDHYTFNDIISEILKIYAYKVSDEHLEKLTKNSDKFKNHKIRNCDLNDLKIIHGINLNNCGEYYLKLKK
jgi:hypothetical protein